MTADQQQQKGILLDLIQLGRHGQCISRNEEQYLTSRLNSTRVGTIRCRPKIHKDPITSRPVANLTGSWMAPVASWFTNELGPVAQSHCKYVVASSDDMLGDGGLPLQFENDPNDPYTLCTIDVQNLYPSIKHECLKKHVCPRLRRFFTGVGPQCIIMLALLDMLVCHQIIESNIDGCKKFYRVIQGITTGLAAGVHLANVMLADLDELVVDTFRSSILYYCRLVDDLFLLVKRSAIAGILELCNKWNDCIKCICTAVGDRGIAYLDTEYSIEFDHDLRTGFVIRKLYQKPMNKYHYVPRGSCHEQGVFTSLVYGEVTRIARRCTHMSDALYFCRLFRARLRRRGYVDYQVNETVHRALNAFNRKIRGVTVSDRNAVDDDSVKVYLQAGPYSSSLNKRFISRALNVHKHVLKAKVRFQVISRVQKNIFRILYPYTWGAQHSRSGGRVVA